MLEALVFLATMNTVMLGLVLRCVWLASTAPIGATDESDLPDKSPTDIAKYRQLSKTTNDDKLNDRFNIKGNVEINLYLCVVTLKFSFVH